MTLSILDLSHLKAVFSFDQQLIPMLPAAMYRPSKQKMTEACLSSGLSLGLFEGDQLVGYRLTFVPALNEENLGYKLGLNDEDMKRVAQFHGILLHPNYRGKGWGTSLLSESLKLVFAQSHDTVLVTVHPDNQPSMKLFNAMGFTVQLRTTLYGGFDRYILAITRQQWDDVQHRINKKNRQDIENQKIILPAQLAELGVNANGKAVLQIRLLELQHETAIHDLDHLLIHKLDPGVYHHTDYALIQQCLLSRLSIGLFLGEQLVGYRLTFIPAQGSVNLGRFLGFSDDDLNQVAQFYGTLLQSDYRGGGLGRALIEENLKLITERGFQVVLVTVHPDNHASLNMCLSCGFEVMQAITFYDGLPRLLLRKYTVA